MEAYLCAFVNFEQNDWAKLLPMAEFAYNNVKNASTGYTPFGLKCGYHPRFSYKGIDPGSRSKATDEWADDLRNLMTACRKNIQHGFDAANPFPPDLWGYVHGFGY